MQIILSNQALNYLFRKAGKNCLNGGQNFQGIEAICEGIEAIFQSALKLVYLLTCTITGLLNPSGVSKFAVFIYDSQTVASSHVEWFHYSYSSMVPFNRGQMIKKNGMEWLEYSIHDLKHASGLHFCSIIT